MKNIVIGKRTTLGAAITSTAAALVGFFPDYAVSIVASAVPITFGAQLWVANKFGVTTKP